MKRLAIAISIATLAGCSGNDIDTSSVVTNASAGGQTTFIPGSSNTGNDTGTSNTGATTGDEAAAENPVSVVDIPPSSEFLALSASHRNGQTFLVWNEYAGASGYHVYRHTAPITANNIGSATRLTERWGPLDQNTSVNRHGSDDVPGNFVINDLTAPLSDDTGLFVHTTQIGEQGNAYYAVTSVTGNSEDRTFVAGSNATIQPINEFVSTPRPVLTLSTNQGKGRVYTQYMDYANWNPTLNGYAYNFAVALPVNYDPAQSYPLMVELHAFGEIHKYEEQAEFNWPFIQMFPSDPGANHGTTHTWWYGFAAEHDYRTQGPIPSSGPVENFTEQRLIASVNFLINDGQFNVDRELVHAFGNSMGASGVVSLGMRYPSVFAGVYASQPMTNYGASPMFQENFTRLWGTQSTNLPIINHGSNISDIQNYDMDGSSPTRVWNWMNHQEQLIRRSSDRFAYLMIDHGKEDGIIDWATQGQPMPQVLTDARVGFAASSVGGVGHNWLGFDSVVHSVFGLGRDDEQAWRYPRSLSFPAIQFATGSGSLQPANTGDDRQNTNIEWATPRNNFHQSIVDTPNRYEITLRSMISAQTASITPRNTVSFKPAAGVNCSWSALDASSNSTIAVGTARVAGNQLLTVSSVPIMASSGTRLTIACP